MSESPLGRGGPERRGGFFLATTHPDAFGFYSSQEVIPFGMLSDNRSLMGFRDKATIEVQNSGRSHFV